VLRSHAQGGGSEGLGLSSYVVPLSRVYALNFLELTSVVWSYPDLTRADIQCPDGKCEVNPADVQIWFG